MTATFITSMSFLNGWSATMVKLSPLRSTLPDKCYNVLPSGDEIIIVKKGESGYYHTDKYGHDRAEAQAIVNECNESGGVTKAQAAAMLAGSMFGRR